ncbi:MAG: LLM class flavin-dependent oxidoreductase [Hymenobacter sp.]
MLVSRRQPSSPYPRSGSVANNAAGFSLYEVDESKLPGPSPRPAAFPLLLMQLGIDSFAAADMGLAAGPDHDNATAMRQLLDRIAHADAVGLDVFGLRRAPPARVSGLGPGRNSGAAAARTTQIRLTSAVTVLSAADPVRVFQQFATLDLIAQGRVEMVVGRGSFTESFPAVWTEFAGLRRAI